MDAIANIEISKFNQILTFLYRWLCLILFSYQSSLAITKAQNE